MLERIWSAWRSAYVTGATVRSGDASPDTAGSEPAPEGSVFTRLLNSGAPDEATYIVHRGATCFALCNLFPYASGHLLVLPYREVADLDGLTADETADLWRTVTDAVRVVRAVYRPDGLNVGLNLGRPAGGSVPDHLHVHVVPRWTGDSNFMAAISNTQNLPEALEDTAAKLRAAWSDVASSP
ncbi:MAG TPA: HIT domain-containing protein [Ilumatobacteraceae bacterium]|nr:HIT domain-containing protein [Ilumatobacteraceae bacterium]